jgi:hypothetical protein
MAAMALPGAIAVADTTGPGDNGGATTAVAASSVPNCVNWRLDAGGVRDNLWVTNRCGSTQRVKVIIANGNDFSCVSYRPGDQWHFQWGWPSRFDRLERC